MKKAFPRYGVYAVITEKFCLNGSSIKTLDAVLKAGVKVVQMREKEMTDRQLILLGRRFRRLTSIYGAVFIMNDRPDIAAKVKADGVHLGQGDMELKEAKKKFSGLIIGISTHNMREALEAQKNGADYINIGPVYATKTKDTSEYRPLGPALVKKIAAKIKIPFSVMGGIKAHNIPELKKSGVKLFAMVTEITMSDDINTKIENLNRIIGLKRT